MLLKINYILVYYSNVLEKTYNNRLFPERYIFTIIGIQLLAHPLSLYTFTS